jgi:hypothetical protein
MNIDNNVVQLALSYLNVRDTKSALQALGKRQFQKTIVAKEGRESYSRWKNVSPVCNALQKLLLQKYDIDYRKIFEYAYEEGYDVVFSGSLILHAVDPTIPMNDIDIFVKKRRKRINDDKEWDIPLPILHFVNTKLFEYISSSCEHNKDENTFAYPLVDSCSTVFEFTKRYKRDDEKKEGGIISVQIVLIEEQDDSPEVRRKYCDLMGEVFGNTYLCQTDGSHDALAPLKENWTLEDYVLQTFDINVTRNYYNGEELYIENINDILARRGEIDLSCYIQSVSPESGVQFPCQPMFRMLKYYFDKGFTFKNKFSLEEKQYLLTRCSRNTKDHHLCRCLALSLMFSQIRYDKTDEINIFDVICKSTTPAQNQYKRKFHNNKQDDDEDEEKTDSVVRRKIEF